MLNLKTVKSALLTAAVLTFAAGVAHAQAGLSDLQIAHAAYTADVIDIEYAKIALAKTKNPEVRQFAELMIRDHSAVNEGAGALLTKLKVKPEDNAFSQALNSGAKGFAFEPSRIEVRAGDTVEWINRDSPRIRRQRTTIDGTPGY
ncbi:MAG TPA: DUF4142 domain-containing protein [Acidobacteriaceae bacterium]|nr:DUF4142 domain-containing protein [Acidobacteriaceae bacterium]